MRFQRRKTNIPWTVCTSEHSACLGIGKLKPICKSLCRHKHGRADLEHVGGGCAAEVQSLREMSLRVVLLAVAFDHHSLGCALLADQQNAFLLTNVTIPFTNSASRPYRKCLLLQRTMFELVSKDLVFIVKKVLRWKMFAV